jgi:hypothetical protein
MFDPVLILFSSASDARESRTDDCLCSRDILHYNNSIILTSRLFNLSLSSRYHIYQFYPSLQRVLRNILASTFSRSHSTTPLLSLVPSMIVAVTNSEAGQLPGCIAHYEPKAGRHVCMSERKKRQAVSTFGISDEVPNTWKKQKECQCMSGHRSPTKVLILEFGI